MKKVILDVDTGTDDAIAIMTAIKSKELEVLGITTVNGNRGIEFTTENTLRVVEYLNANIPVYKGCSLPIVSTLKKGRRNNVPYKGPEDPKDNVHGDYIDLPSASIKEEKDHAVWWLIETLMNSNDEITLIPVGPLTNIAMAIRLEPKIINKIKKIIIMGGGYKEVNITPSAEFNFWVDPEAAKIVIDSGCDITLVPLDATHAAAISISDANHIKDKNTKTGILTAKIIEQRLQAYKHWQPMSDVNTVPIHDALAVCAAINESVLKNVIEVYADIDIGGGTADGMSIFDIDKRYKDKKTNIKVALNADKKLFRNMLLEIL